MRKLKTLNIIMVILNVLLIFFLITKLFFFSPPNSNDIWKSSKDSVFVINVYKDDTKVSSATSFMIDDMGHIITNKHVVEEDNTTIYVDIFDKEYLATIIDISEKYDIALLVCDYKTSNYLKLNDKNLLVGDTVYTIGNPNGIGLAFEEGIISAPKKNLIIDNESFLVLQTNMVLNEGNSGGPILNAYGEVVGIVSFRLRDNIGNVLDGMSFGYASHEILELID